MPRRLARALTVIGAIATCAMLSGLESIAAAATAAHAPESIEYRLDWWVGKDGTTTKVYTIHYQGPETLRKLKKYQSDPRFLDMLLPSLEPADTLIEKKTLAPGHFRWLYRGTKHDMSIPRKSLMAWIPVFEDPIAIPWSRHENSRYLFDFRQLTVTHRLTVRGPWNFASEPLKRENQIAGDAVSAKLETRELNEPDTQGIHLHGWDQPGFEASSTVTSLERGSVRNTNLRVQWENLWTWFPARTELFGFMGTPDTTSAPVYNHVSFRFPFDWSSVAVTDRNYSALALGAGIEYRRRFTQNWIWKVLGLDYLVGIGWQAGTTYPKPTDTNNFIWHDLALSSFAEYRLPLGISTATGQPFIKFLDFFAGPELHRHILTDYTVSLKRTGTQYGTTVGIRWGLSNARLWMNPVSGAALVFRYTAYGSQSPFGSIWMLGLEVL